MDTLLLIFSAGCAGLTGYLVSHILILRRLRKLIREKEPAAWNLDELKLMSKFGELLKY